jgi:hypothetical protein
MRRIVGGLAFCCLAALSCGRSEATKREEIRNCSAISLDAPGISRCLVAQYRWKEGEATVAGAARQRELDSVATFQRDSAWRVDAPRHREEFAKCRSAGGDVARCLEGTYGWDPERAAANADSVWRREASKHRSELQACERQRKSSVGSCLMLYYKWDPQRALGVDDSIARAKVAAQNSR